MKESTPDEIEIARIYRRFYAALQLRDLCNEMPIHAVARKYDLPRGRIQNLAQTCHGFAAGMIKFCERMHWGALAVVLDHFSDRLKAGRLSIVYRAFVCAPGLLLILTLLQAQRRTFWHLPRSRMSRVEQQGYSGKTDSRLLPLLPQQTRRRYCRCYC